MNLNYRNVYREAVWCFGCNQLYTGHYEEHGHSYKGVDLTKEYEIMALYKSKAVNSPSSAIVTPETELKGKFIVWSPESNLPPRMVYPTKADAVKVATIMAKKHPESRFAVAELAGVAQVSTVKYESF